MLVRTDSSAAIHRMAACSMHNTLHIYYKFTWTRTQADAKSVFSGRALRLHVTIETSSAVPSGVLLGSHVRKLADSRRARCILKREQDQHPAHL